MSIRRDIMKPHIVFGIFIIITGAMFCGCVDSGAHSNSSSTTDQSTQQKAKYDDPLYDEIFNKYYSLQGNHYVYIVPYIDRNSDYYTQNPDNVAIIDDVASRLDNIIPGKYVAKFYIKTVEESPSYPKCYATIFSKRIHINEQFNQNMVELVNYIYDTYHINRTQITIVDVDTKNDYYWIRTSGDNYENVRVIYLTENGKKYRIYYWNRNVNDYRVDELN
jgi:hypothetical protein